MAVYAVQDIAERGVALISLLCYVAKCHNLVASGGRETFVGRDVFYQDHVFALTFDFKKSGTTGY